MLRTKFAAVTLSAGLAIFGASSIGQAQQAREAATPARMELSDDGPVLVTPAGMTLYTYGPDDNLPGTSQCSNVPKRTYNERQAGLGNTPLLRADIHKSCTEKWPPFLADANAQPTGDFALLNRPEGGRQWTYRARPLYLSIRDTKPGDRFGAAPQAVAGNRRGWQFATWPLDLPASLRLVRREEGLMLVTAEGRPIYTPRGRYKTCDGCEEVLKPVTAPGIAKVNGDWSIVETSAGRKQYAFKGKPLYAPPVSLSDVEIDDTGAWEKVIYREGPGRPPEIETRFTLMGDLYTDKAGHTLYLFTCRTPANDGVNCDDPGDPAGYMAALCGDGDECARRWRPYLAGPEARSVGEWSVIDVAYPMFTDPNGITFPPEAPRVKAWAYRGQPAYTYYEDTEPGEFWGNIVQWVLFSQFRAITVPGRGT